MDSPASICVYPLSPPYLPSHRYLYYVSLIISLLYPTPPPLVKGAFAFSLAYASTAAVYAFAIAGVSTSSQVVNLDLFGLWAILSSASIAVLPFLEWNKNLQDRANKGSRSIVRLWGLLVIAAMIYIYVSMLKAKARFQYDIPQGLDFDQCQLLIKELGRAKLKLRNPEDILAADYSRIFGTMYGWITSRISGLVFLPTAFGLISCVFTIIRQTPVRHEENALGDFVDQSGHYTCVGFRNAFLQLNQLAVYLTPLLIIPTIVLNELYLLKGGGLPEGEKIYEIGQWGIFAGAGLVGAAALVNAVLGTAKKAAKSIDIDGGYIENFIS
jgi:hypothetical protein